MEKLNFLASGFGYARVRNGVMAGTETALLRLIRSYAARKRERQDRTTLKVGAEMQEADRAPLRVLQDFVQRTLYLYKKQNLNLSLFFKAIKRSKTKEEHI